MSEQDYTWDNDPLWYKDAIIYQLHVKAYYDSNNDGIGDFAGLTSKLDYVQSLGVNTVWLLPFYPSPLKDDGYDIADYHNIHEQYGTRKDFRYFVREAHRRGLRVITELVINHTSDQNPWFQAARRAPKGSRKRDFYVWSDDDQKYPETRIIFTDTETSNWAWDPVAQQYYWHRFFSHQPDLNHNNPAVVQAVIRIMRFWLDAGVDGLRLDAIPYLCVREGTANENLPETHAVLKHMRHEVDAHYQNRMFLAEANQWPEDVREYFGDGDECHVAYHFPLMPRMYMAIAQEDRYPIVEIMAQTPDIPDNCQWAIFLRNHDELTLEMVTDRERDYMYHVYAADPRMRVNVGIRRRLASLLGNDLDVIKLMNSLLMTMPGSPIVYYGDEIGMGDNIYLGDRNSVRTPMQWSPDRNAGFSKADPQKLYLPPIMDPIYGFDAVNVEAQNRNPASLLNWMRRLIAVRKNHQAFGRGTLKFLRPGNRKILAYLREYRNEVILCVANLARTAQPVELDLGAYKTRVPVELMGSTAFPPIGELPYLLTLPGRGFYWFRLSETATEPAWYEERLLPAELPVLVLTGGWQSFFSHQSDGNRRAIAAKAIAQFEQEILPSFLANRRWFAAKGEPVRQYRLLQRQLWQDWLLTWVAVELEQGTTQIYFLPLALGWERKDNEDALRALLPRALTRVRQHARVGIIYDAFADEAFCRALVQAMAEQRHERLEGAELVFSATAAFAGLLGETAISTLGVQRAPVEGSNTALVLGNTFFLKGYRRQQGGVNLELEIGRYLTEMKHAHSVPVAGAVEYRCGDERRTLALLQGFVRNQGDAWTYVCNALNRHLDDCRGRPLDEIGGVAQEFYAVFLMMMRLLGQRTGELHRLLARATADPAFAPEPLTVAEVHDWQEQVRFAVQSTLAQLERRRFALPELLHGPAVRLLEADQSLLARVDALDPAAVESVKIRYHGDYHLGQVLVVENDFFIIDFEGEPARAPAERRAKSSPLKDVAGMLRSFDYAAQAMLIDVTNERPNDAWQLAPLVADWCGRTQAAFLAGYRAAVADTALWPADAQAAQQLLDLFVVEKALYELRYELDHRPQWVGVPIQGLLALAANG